MINSTDFFNEPPLEVLEHIYSRLDTPEDFVNAWLTNNRHHQRAIELALFNKEDIDFYPAQLKILTILINSQEVLLGGDREYLESLGRKLSSLLKNPQLSIKQLIQGLKLTAAIHQVTLSTVDISRILSLPKFMEWSTLEPDLVEVASNEELKIIVDAVQKNLNAQRSLDRDVAESFLVALVQRADKKALVPILDSIKKILDNLNQKTKASSLFLRPHNIEKEITLWHLTLLAPIIEKEMMGAFVDSVKNLLVSSDAEFPEEGALGLHPLDCLAQLAPFLDKNTLETLIEPVSKILDTTDRPNPSLGKHEEIIAKKANWAAAKCLVAFSRGMDKEIPLSLVINSLKNKLDAPDEENQVTALRFLVEFAPVMENAAQSLLDSVINKLNDNDIGISGIALNCLKVLIPGMDKERYKPLIETIRNKLNDEKSHVRIGALYFLVALTPRLEKGALASLIEPLTDMVNDKNEDVCIAALRCLPAFAPAMDNETQLSLIDLVQSKLNAKANSVRHHAWDCLAVLAPMMKKETLTTLIKLAQDGLNDKNRSYRKAALNFLAAQAARIEKETLKNLVEYAKSKLDEPNGDAEATIHCLAMLAPEMDKVTLAELIGFLKNKLDAQNGSITIDALNCLIALTPSMDKNMLATLAASVNEKLYNPNYAIRHAACHLMCYLLVNSDVSLKLDSHPSSSTPDSLLVQEVAGWVAQIQSVINEQKSLEAKDSPDVDTNARLS